MSAWRRWHTWPFKNKPACADHYHQTTFDMNTGMRLYQSLQRAAKAVEAGKPGARAKLAEAKKKYVQHVDKQAKKEAAEKIKDAKTRAAKIGSVKAKPKAKAKTAAKRTTAKRTAKKRK